MKKKSSAIEIAVPKPWKWVCLLFIATSFIVNAVVVYLTVFTTNPMSRDDLLVALFGLGITTLATLFAMPCFIGRYPSWFVSLVGRPYLEQFIQQCGQYLGKNRAVKGNLTDPSSWWADHRMVWIALILGFLVLGLIGGLRA